MRVDLEFVGKVLAVASAILGALWWVYRHAQRVGEWKAQRESNEARAKDETRLTINRLEPKIDNLTAVNRLQSETLAVIAHRTNSLERDIKELSDTVDDHGNRLTKLEIK